MPSNLSTFTSSLLSFLLIDPRVKIGPIPFVYHATPSKIFKHVLDDDNSITYNEGQWLAYKLWNKEEEVYVISRFGDDKEFYEYCSPDSDYYVNPIYLAARCEDVYLLGLIKKKASKDNLIIMRKALIEHFDEDYVSYIMM